MSDWFPTDFQSGLIIADRLLSRTLMLFLVPFSSIVHSQYLLNPNYLSPERRKTDWDTDETADDADRWRDVSVSDNQQRGARSCSLTECMNHSDAGWTPVASTSICFSLLLIDLFQCTYLIPVTEGSVYTTSPMLLLYGMKCLHW